MAGSCRIQVPGFELIVSRGSSPLARCDHWGYETGSVPQQELLEIVWLNMFLYCKPSTNLNRHGKGEGKMVSPQNPPIHQQHCNWLEDAFVSLDFQPCWSSHTTHMASRSASGHKHHMWGAGNEGHHWPLKVAYQGSPSTGCAKTKRRNWCPAHCSHLHGQWSGHVEVLLCQRLSRAPGVPCSYDLPHGQEDTGTISTIAKPFSKFNRVLAQIT